jgi:hypothetical protein
MTRTTRPATGGRRRRQWFGWMAVAISVAIGLAGALRGSEIPAAEDRPNQVLEWNQIFIEMLIATNTANSSSQRLGAIVHTAIFDAFNGVERRYGPVLVPTTAPRGASRRAAVIAAAYTALVGLFPAREAALTETYVASLAALSDDDGDGGASRERGIAWGTEVARAVLAWRATDGFNPTPPYPAFTGGTAIGQWRPTPPAFGAMSAQGLAFTSMFVLVSNTQFDPGSPRGLAASTYADDFNAVKAIGRRSGSTRTVEQTELAPFWEGNASVHLESGRQSARAQQPSVNLRQQQAAGGAEYRHGGHGVFDLERQASLRQRAGRNDMETGDGHPARPH